MNTEQVLRKHWSADKEMDLYEMIAEDPDPFTIMEAMKEYAEYYALKVLDVAADNATARIQNWDDPVVNTRSILNIKLPEHE